MYIAYGWPKLLSIGAAQPQPVVHLSAQEGWLLLVTSLHVQLWSANQHKVRLGQCKRDAPSVLRDGLNVHAVWNEKASIVAVLTSESYLHFYHIDTTDKQLRSSSQDNLGLSLVSVIFSSSVDASLYNRTVTVSCIAGDDFNIILGLSNHCLKLVSWHGEVLGVSDVVQGFIYASETTQLLESTKTVASPGASSHPVPALPPIDDSRSVRKGTGFSQLQISTELQLLVAVCSDGTVILSSVSRKGSKQGTEIIPEKWVGVYDAVCASIAHDQQLLAIGTRRGTVELFNLADSALFLRTISLIDWGYAVEDTGPVCQVTWTPDNRAFAVGWRNRGLAVWSASGCRLMCTIRQGSMSNSQSPSPRVDSDRSTSEPMVEGVAALAWEAHGYELFSAERGNTSRFFEFHFAKSSASQGISGITNLWQLLHGADRVLLVQPDENNDIKIQHLVIPHSYMADNWPVLHVAGNEDGTYLAIAGCQGLILHDVQMKKWRVFGDVCQERQVQCAGVVWLGKIVVICNFRKDSNRYELCLYPRYHLDETSLLCRKQLPGKPIAIDVWQDFILVTCPPFDMYVFKAHIQGDLSPLKVAAVQLFTVRELSIMSTRKAPVGMHFVPNIGPWSDGTTNNAWDSPRVGTNIHSWTDGIGEAVSKQPTRCMILRPDGELSLLDLDRGNERRLLSGVERFWLNCGQGKEETDLTKEDPCWAYGPQGMQVWYPSSTACTNQSPSVRQLEPELDFDREVYPLGLSPAAGIIVGISQRLTLSTCSSMPCFEPTPQAQPILPCLLWNLLQRNKLEEAVQLARQSEGLPHFSYSLEWLLFTVFDAAMSSQSTNKRRGRNIAVKRTIFLLLQQVCNLIHNFPEYLDVLVSVARKTDSRHWPELFAVAGNSIKLFEECFEKGLYRTATCYILVIEKLEGPTISQHSAIRLLKATLEVSMYELAGELVRFLLRCGRDGEFAEKESVRYGNGLLSSILGLTISSPWVGKEQNYAVVKRTLEEHASFLLRKMELRELVAFVKGTHFDFTAYLRTERGKAARLDDFASALRSVGQKVAKNQKKLHNCINRCSLMEVLAVCLLWSSCEPAYINLLCMDRTEGQEDAEFLLGHMRAVGFQEWIVVLATLLGRAEVLVKVFQGDPRLWQAYSHTLQESEIFSSEYKDLLAELENDLTAAAT